jgi:hypothetical protein
MSSTKTTIYPNSLIQEREGERERERGLSVFEKKRKGEELTNWHGGTGPSRR